MQTQVRTSVPGAGATSTPRVANAPLSYGAFEITVGTDFQVPDPEDVLGAIGAAGYDWRERIGVVHLKDTRLDVLAQVRAERADMISAWRRGLFCALGDGDVDLAGFCAALQATGYDGWVVIEQDRVLDHDGAFSHAAGEQRGNRDWLREHAGW